MAPQHCEHSCPIINPPAPHAGTGTHFSPLSQGLSQRSSYQSATATGCSSSATPLTTERRYLLSVDRSCTDTLTTPGNHLVTFQFCWQKPHSAPCVRPTHLGVENDPTIKMCCRRSLLSAPLELLGATSQPGASKQKLKKSVCVCKHFDVVLISLLIWRAPPNV